MGLTNGNKIWGRWITGSVAMAVMTAMISYAVAVKTNSMEVDSLKADVGDNETAIEELSDEKVDQESFQEVKEDVKDMTIKVAKIETRQESMESDIKEIKDDMKEGFKAIMEKLDED